MPMLGSFWKIKQTFTWIYYIDVKVFFVGYDSSFYIYFLEILL